MKKQHSAAPVVAGFLAGMMVGLPAVQATTSDIKATPSKQAIYVDGQPVSLNAFTIGGSNYVTLRDAGRVVGFNVYWQPNDSTVRIETDKPYTGEAPGTSSPVQSTPAQSIPSAPMPATDIEAMRQEIVDRTNAIREENGVSKVRMDPMMMKAAQVRAEEMAATGVYSHTRPNGTSQRTVTNCPYNSENIHRFSCDFIAERGISAAEFAVRGWRFSDGHLSNMLKADVTRIGVGIAKGLNEYGEDAWYCVQWFMRDGYSITWVDTPRIP